MVNSSVVTELEVVKDAIGKIMNEIDDSNAELKLWLRLFELFYETHNKNDK